MTLYARASCHNRGNCVGNDLRQRQEIESLRQQLAAFMPRDRYYLVKCHECGWVGSSEHTAGGGAIADTGDYDEILCPCCLANKDKCVQVDELDADTKHLEAVIRQATEPLEKKLAEQQAARAEIERLTKQVKTLQSAHAYDTGKLQEKLDKLLAEREELEPAFYVWEWENGSYNVMKCPISDDDAMYSAPTHGFKKLHILFAHPAVPAVPEEVMRNAMEQAHMAGQMDAGCGAPGYSNARAWYDTKGMALLAAPQNEKERC